MIHAPRTLRLAVTLVLSLLGAPAWAEDNVCSNPTLQEVFRIVHAACDTENCDEAKLEEINVSIPKHKLMAAMRLMNPIHVFFPSGRSTMQDALDFATSKKDQIAMLQEIITAPEETVVYVIGRGSRTGSQRKNFELARRRTLAVFMHLARDLKLKCRYVQKVAFGKTVLQLSRSDANLLNIAPNDYRSDERILNQSVEIFVYPCRNRLPTEALH